MNKAVEQTLESVTPAECEVEPKERNNPKIRKMPEPALAPTVNIQSSAKRQKMKISNLCNDKEIVFEEKSAKKTVETFISLIPLLHAKQNAVPAKEPTFKRKYRKTDPRLKAMLGEFKIPKTGPQPVSVGNNPNSLFSKMTFNSYIEKIPQHFASPEEEELRKSLKPKADT